MLPEEQIEEIKKHLKNAINPLFFFDNDADGLCSYLLLSRYVGGAKGVAIKSFPKLSKGYARKLYELKPDYVFILDKPNVEKGFIEEAKKLSLPIVWIDHHKVEQEIPEGVDYYNPIMPGEGIKKTGEPVSYWCHKIVNQDLWVAMTGCIGDHYIPNFSEEFGKEYPELWNNPDKASEALYETGIGKLARIFEFALKDRTSKVVRMIKKLQKVNSPHEILKPGKNNKILERFNEINHKFENFIDKAKKEASDDKILFFQYGGGLSLSGDIANKLSYLYPHKIIVVAYIKGSYANISVRGDKIREIILEALDELDDASGGGHENAVGCRVRVKDLDKFKKKIEELSGK